MGSERPYRVITADRAGCTYEYDFALFPSAVRFAERQRARYPDLYVTIVNTDRMDHYAERMIDGLTDDERAEVP